MRGTVVAALIVAGALGGCQLAPPDAACPPEALPKQAGQLIATQPQAFETVLAWLLADVPCWSGDWPHDHGDAHVYAPLVLHELADRAVSACLAESAAAAADADRALLSEGRQWPPVFWLRAPEQVMATHGLVEVRRFDPGADDVALIDSSLDKVNAALAELGFYPTGLGRSILSYYGPTTHVAEIAVLNLRYSSEVGGVRAAERREFALRLIEAADANAYDAERGVYRFDAGHDGLYLYPNVLMMLANCLAFSAAGEPAYLDRARTLHAGIQPLRTPAGYYRSPYSAEQMGATTDDFSTLSSQLYLVLALGHLYERTREARFLVEARSVLEWVTTHLLVDGRLVHHWIDGRPARPSDPEYYCTGCNFQALYAMMYVSELEGE